eukprot:m.205816 g.205816  ORF g.205816 m.205816 type:complete len:334 (-) comp18883_c0_seq1:122-1123(-)
MKSERFLRGVFGVIIFLMSLFHLMPFFRPRDLKGTARNYGSVFPALHIVQFGDEQYSKTMAYYTQSIRRLAACDLSYDYSFKLDNGQDYGRSEGMCLYTSKVDVIRQALLEYDIGDWILWVDLDVFYAANGCDRFEHLVRSKVNGSCEFSSLTSPHTINSGILFVKVTPAMRKFVSEWHARQVAVNYCVGPADQMTLQETYLRAVNSTYNGECEHGHPIARNECFTAISPTESRSVDGFCFFQCNDTFQTHDCDTVHSSLDDLFWHGKIGKRYLTVPVRFWILMAYLSNTNNTYTVVLECAVVLIFVLCCAAVLFMWKQHTDHHDHIGIKHEA